MRASTIHARARLLSVLSALATVTVGCWTPPKATSEQQQRGLVWIFPGIGAGPTLMSGAYQGLRDGGVEGEIRFSKWDRPLIDVLGHLQKHDANRALAANVAAQTAEYWREHPGASIDLVGYSAGGGIALMVAEELPGDVRLRHVVLVQPGVSPTWDLTRALQNVDGRMINLYCRSDWLILGAGTRSFGTVDREYVSSAGKEGFCIETAVPDAKSRGKLIQRAWDPKMLWTGHWGGHAGILLYEWNKRYVAPFLLDDAGESPRTAAAQPATRPARTAPPPASSTQPGVLPTSPNTCYPCVRPPHPR